MKHCLILFLALWICSSAQARAFKYGVFVHRVDEQTRVEIYASFPEDDRHNLTVTEAIAYLKIAPYSRGNNQIGIIAEGCGAADYTPLLKAVVDGLPHATLAYFGTSGSESLLKFFEVRRSELPNHRGATEH